MTIDKPTVFPVEKDRHILFSTLASADVLLSLDRADFSRLLGDRFYGLAIMTPGMWHMVSSYQDWDYVTCPLARRQTCLRLLPAIP